MNKKGFTLVELLAVVAILGILVIMAMPNVLGSFQSAQKDTFVNNAVSLINAVQQDYILDKTKNFSRTGYFYYSTATSVDVPNNVNTPELLSVNSSGNLRYFIEVDSGKGIIKNFKVCNDNMLIKMPEIAADDIDGITNNDVKSAVNDTTKYFTGKYNASCEAE